MTAWLTKLIPSMKTQVPVFLPRNFVARVVRDVMRMSEGEVYGIRLVERYFTPGTVREGLYFAI